MKIVPMSAKLVWQTSDPEIVVEEMGRICYQSDHKMRDCPECVRPDGLVMAPCGWCKGRRTDPATSWEFVAKILANGHESVLEHVALGLKLVVDRGVTHELVRHRIGVAFSQESIRYCDYAGDRFGGELSFVEPPGLSSDPVEDAVSGAPMSSQRELWFEGLAASEQAYRRLRQEGVRPEIARGVLPNALKAEIGVTANAREWRHVMRLRLSPRAHPQMRQAMGLVLPLLKHWFPQAFEEFAV